MALNIEPVNLVTIVELALEVTVASSAAEALMLFDRQPPDILISDIGMPDIDGYMLMQQIRQRSPSGGFNEAMPSGKRQDVPTIALTADAGE
jgi:CheY-like chemotaxis protein